MKKTIKTEALINAKNALKAYLQKYRLSPLIDWRKDKVHGKEVTRLVNKLNLERDKVLDNYPYDDIKNETKRITMSKDKKKDLKKKAVKAPEAAPKKEVKKETSKKAITKYDYPLVDGREMTKEEKKKYRAEQRKAANGNAPKEKKEAPKAEKKAKTKLPEKPLKESKDKKKVLKKKVKKEED